MTDIPEDVMKAAEQALDNLLCHDKESCGGYQEMRAASIKEIAHAIMSEREERRLEIERFREALLPFAKVAGTLPYTCGPHHDPIEADEPVNISCAGFSLDSITASDLNHAYEMVMAPAVRS